MQRSPQKSKSLGVATHEIAKKLATYLFCEKEERMQHLQQATAGTFCLVTVCQNELDSNEESLLLSTHKNGRVCSQVCRARRTTPLLSVYFQCIWNNNWSNTSQFWRKCHLARFKALNAKTLLERRHQCLLMNPPYRNRIKSIYCTSILLSTYRTVGVTQKYEYALLFNCERPLTVRTTGYCCRYWYSS